MRISTSQIYDINVSNINKQQLDVVQLQRQLSTGKRVVNPSDDPVAAARALEVSQASAQTAMHLDAQGSANDLLSMLDSKLASLSELFTYVRERAIQGGTSTINQDDRNAIAADMEAQFNNLLSIANTTDANGEYLFSGFKGDVQAFTGDLSGVTYQGDQGQRSVRVSNSRNIPVSLNGEEVLMRIQTTGSSFNPQASLGNSGTATIASNGVVGTYAGGQYGIRFTSATTYNIYDRAADPAMTGTPMVAGAAYTAGSAINLPPAPAAAEIQITINGTPATGDSFLMNPGSGTTDAFSILSDFISNLRTGGTGPAYFASIQDTMSLADNAMENLLRLRAQVGSEQIELDSLGNVAQDLQVQYADRTDRLVGLDYASAISDFQLQQTYLEASRTTFVKSTNMNLFSFLT
ncbi:flagellar hook-associated protein FlgL [Viridibacterium curvum]|uniref:Flagellar hook-associated protein FlgL n=1 Tax=Viridibacterium curvum TaxID=1101404 RepID=A0ABP9QAJ8_9RHOO